MKRLVICTNVRPAVDIVTTVFTLHGNVSLTLNLVPLKTIIHSLRPMQRRRVVADAVLHVTVKANLPRYKNTWAMSIS